MWFQLCSPPTNSVISSGSLVYDHVACITRIFQCAALLVQSSGLPAVRLLVLHTCIRKRVHIKQQVKHDETKRNN